MQNCLVFCDRCKMALSLDTNNRLPSLCPYCGYMRNHEEPLSRGVTVVQCGT